MRAIPAMNWSRCRDLPLQNRVRAEAREPALLQSRLQGPRSRAPPECAPDQAEVRAQVRAAAVPAPVPHEGAQVVLQSRMPVVLRAQGAARVSEGGVTPAARVLAKARL